jgi:hypothetical protein
MYLIIEVMVTTCLRDPKSSIEFKIRIWIWRFKFLYSVVRLAESAIFENLFESNQTLLLKENLFLMTCVKVVLWHFHRSRHRSSPLWFFFWKAFSLLIVSSRWMWWTRWFTWFGPPERNTLRPRENWVVLCSSMSCLSLFFFWPLWRGVYPVLL